MSVKLLACAALLASCTHHRPLARLSHLSASDRVLVRTSTGETEAIVLHTKRGVMFQTDAGEWIDPASVIRVTDKSHALGAVEGMGIVGGIGILGGLIAGYASGDDPPCEGFCLFNMTAGEKATMGATVFGLGGIVLGLLFGGVQGSEIVYENSETQKITPNGPPGSVAGMTMTF